MSGLDPTASDPAQGADYRWRNCTGRWIQPWLRKAAETLHNWRFAPDSRPLSALKPSPNLPDNHMVLLGLPGTGKTTFIRYRAAGFCPGADGTHLTSNLPEWKQPSILLPVIVPLARFADASPAGVITQAVANFILQFLKDDNRAAVKSGGTEIQNRDCFCSSSMD